MRALRISRVPEYRGPNDLAGRSLLPDLGLWCEDPVYGISGRARFPSRWPADPVQRWRQPRRSLARAPEISRTDRDAVSRPSDRAFAANPVFPRSHEFTGSRGGVQFASRSDDS